MGNLLKYSGIVTKIRAMEAKLLTPEQFADIANLRSVRILRTICGKIRRMRKCLTL